MSKIIKLLIVDDSQFMRTVLYKMMSRIPEIQILCKEANAWYRRRNGQQKGVDWQFATKNARIKLKRFYPQIQT